jgi:uncharacterized protein (TIGR00269 family)
VVPGRDPKRGTRGAPAQGNSGPKCAHCPQPAVEHIRYAGVHLCRSHFLGFVEKRVKRTVREQGGIPQGATVGVAVSGGKDSIVCLRLLHQILAPRLPPEQGGQSERGDVRLVVLSVDEGIKGYREAGLEAAAATAKALHLEHQVISNQKLLGLTMDEVHTVKQDQNECSYCGVFRRNALNHIAQETGCDLLATGHNLDDSAQAVLMNLTTGDPSRLARLGPHTHPKPGMVPRFLPLRWIPEREAALTAILQGWAYDDQECPYAVNAQRGLYRDMLLRLEQQQPGTRHSLLRTLDTLKPLLASLDDNAGQYGTCRICNGPASQELCQTCRLGDTVRARLSARRAQTGPPTPRTP